MSTRKNGTKSQLKPFKLLASVDGKLTGIYNDNLIPLIREGKSETKRASHVEPSEDGKGWVATMNDGTQLGPFESRQEALDKEVEYLEGKLFV